MHSTSLLWLLKEFRGWNWKNFIPSASAYAFGRRPNFLQQELRLRPNVKNTASVILWSESLNYCPKKYLSLIYIYRRSHRIYWSLCSYWRKSSFKYSKKSSLETPYKRQIYLQYWKWPRMDHWSFERYGNTGCGVSSSGIQH